MRSMRPLPLLACALLACASAPTPRASSPADVLHAAPRRDADAPIVVGVFSVDGVAEAERAGIQSAFVAALGEERSFVIVPLEPAEVDGVAPAGVDEAARAFAAQQLDVPDVFVWPRATRQGDQLELRTEVLSAYGTGRATHTAVGRAGAEVSRGAAGTTREFITATLAPGLPDRSVVRRVRRTELANQAAWLRDAFPERTGRHAMGRAKRTSGSTHEGP